MSQSPSVGAAPTTVSVLVPTYRRPTEVQRCLRGLAGQTRRPDEVLVVVQPEDAPSRAVLAQPWEVPVREVLVDRPGLVAARNAGIAAATSVIVAFIDDDAVAASDWLERMLVYYADATIGAVGGRDVMYHGGTLAQEGRRRQVGVLTWYGRFVSMHPRGVGPAREVDFVKGVNMSFDRARNPDLRVDENLRGRGAQVHEETSLCLQLRDRGYRVVYDPEILVDHYEADRGDDDPRSPQVLRARRDRHHNQTYVVARHYPVARLVVHVLYAVVVGMADAPGLLLTLRNIVRTRTLSGHLLPLVANVQGRGAGILSALRWRREHRASR
ncbi:MAG: glycosyltransferase family 2 protein [Janthinobacterium lividum]